MNLDSKASILLSPILHCPRGHCWGGCGVCWPNGHSIVDVAGGILCPHVLWQVESSLSRSGAFFVQCPYWATVNSSLEVSYESYQLNDSDVPTETMLILNFK